MSRLRTTALIAAGVPLVLLLLLIVAWAVDASTGGHQVMRNVSVAGHDVGGLGADALHPVLGRVADELATTAVELHLPQTTLSSTAAELGLTLDEARTADAALDVGRSDPLPLRPFVWLGSFFRHRHSGVFLTADPNQVASALRRFDDQVRSSPREPSITYQDGRLAVVGGATGTGLDPTNVAEALARVTDISHGVVAISVEAAPIAPKFSDASADELARRLTDATSQPLRATVAGETRAIPADDLRRLLRAEQAGDKLVGALDQAGTLALLTTLFDGVGTPATDAGLTVSGGRVVIQPGSSGTACCDPASVGRIADALNGNRRDVALALTETKPERSDDHYAKLGIVEKVAEFTTRHPAGAPRVTNIHRMSDIVQGAVIEPGDSFSVNDYVGPRTIAKGFVAAPIIGENGYFEDDVGGGVSQFATTLFNAAFFAGLEIPEYQAHGIYISRYPYGREATLDFGNIDLRLRNNTPYGILIWPTYTDSSITVALYSTRYIEAGQSSQFEETYGAVCKRVTTVRERTWLTTGETKYDRFYALYTPDEGIQCDGTKLPKPGEPEPPATTTTTSSTPAATTTTANAATTTTTTAATTTTTTTTSAPPTTASTATTTTAAAKGG